MVRVRGEWLGFGLGLGLVLGFRCREFIIMINSDVFKNLLIIIVNSKVELMLELVPFPA